MVSWDGHIPGDPECKRCGIKLNADGGHLAETYAGTFNGLCYPCTKLAAYPEHKHTLDGAVTWSHPPTEPSWRRDRQGATAYPDCPVCNGVGGQVVYRSGLFGGRIFDRCMVCFDRYWAHPERHEMARRGNALRAAAEAIFELLGLVSPRPLERL